MPSYAYDARVRLDEGGDPRAIGGAVTVALCGHWQHDGLCEFPHLTSFERDRTNRIAANQFRVHVDFTASEDDEPRVLDLVKAALANGRLEGPDGTTTWSLL